MSEISYQGIDEADLVFALYHGTRPMGFGIHQNKPDLTLEDVKKDLAEMDSQGRSKTNGSYSFDYYHGRPLKVGLDTEKKLIRYAHLYDRDAGAGATQRIIDSLKKA